MSNALPLRGRSGTSTIVVALGLVFAACSWVEFTTPRDQMIFSAGELVLAALLGGYSQKRLTGAPRIVSLLLAALTAAVSIASIRLLL